MFFRVLPLIAVVACVPPETSGSDPEEVGFLLENHEDFRERTRVLEGASGRFEVGPWYEGTSLAEREYTVTQLGDDAVQVFHRTYTAIELLIWVEHRDLALTPPVPTFTHGDAGVRLPAGAEIEVLDASGGDVRVGYHSHVIEADAWMDRDRLDVYWVDEPDEAPYQAHWDGHALGPDTELFDAPHGERVGWIRALNEGQGAEPFHTVEVMEHWQDWTRVRGDTDLLFDAWVPSEQVHQTHTGFGYGWGRSWGCGGHGYLGLQANVAGGAWLHASPDGPVVGRATQDVWLPELEVDGEADGWARAEVQTPLGKAEIWIAPSDRLEGA